jgi:hypothetical protein
LALLTPAQHQQAYRQNVARIAVEHLTAEQPAWRERLGTWTEQFSQWAIPFRPLAWNVRAASEASVETVGYRSIRLTPDNCHFRASLTNTGAPLSIRLHGWAIPPLVIVTGLHNRSIRSLFEASPVIVPGEINVFDVDVPGLEDGEYLIFAEPAPNVRE